MLIVTCFEIVSGLKIDMKKSEIILVREVEDVDRVLLFLVAK